MGSRRKLLAGGGGGTQTVQGSLTHSRVSGCLSHSGGCRPPPDSVRTQNHCGKPSSPPDQPCPLPLTHPMLSPAKPVAWRALAPACQHDRNQKSLSLLPPQPAPPWVLPVS